MKKISGKIQVPLHDGNKADVTYYVSVSDYSPEQEKDIIKTIENKIKNLDMLMEKIPIDTEKFLQMLRMQLVVELGLYSLKLYDVALDVERIEVPKEEEEVAK